MHLIPCSSPSDVAVRCADLVAEVLERHAAPVFLAPAGRTPVGLYEELARRTRSGLLDLERAHFVQLDELVGVPSTDPRSFQRFLIEHLQGPAGLSREHMHLLDGGAADPAEELVRHGKKLSQLGVPALALLGIGLNGHVAFNEPGSTGESRAQVVSLADATIDGLRKSFEEHELPSSGMTLGLVEILGSDALALLATGRSKARVVAALLEGSNNSALPASHLVGHPSLRLFADEEARGRI